MLPSSDSQQNPQRSTEGFTAELIAGFTADFSAGSTGHRSIQRRTTPGSTVGFTKACTPPLQQVLSRTHGRTQRWTHRRIHDRFLYENHDMILRGIHSMFINAFTEAFAALS